MRRAQERRDAVLQPYVFGELEVRSGHRLGPQGGT